MIVKLRRVMKAGFHFVMIVFFVQQINAQQHMFPPEKEKWVGDSLGNHRAVVQVFKDLDKITVNIPWRNKNVHQGQRIIVIDSSRNKIVRGVEPIEINEERGVIRFHPESGKGIYYIYYLPYSLDGRANYPTASFLKQQNHIAVNDWNLSDEKEVTLLRIESVDQFNSNNPMEVIATSEEVKKISSRNANKTYLVFPERRDNPIKMKTHLPKKWVTEDYSLNFNDQAHQGEYFSFQLGIWAKDQTLENIKIQYSDLKNEQGKVISKNELSCFNITGIDYTGASFTKEVNVVQGKVQALWFGLKVPEQIPAGVYTGTLIVKPKNAAETKVKVSIKIQDGTLPNDGIQQPWKQTRLHWINSTLAHENSVIEPYTPIDITGQSLSILGRKVILGPMGLPEEINSYFDVTMTSVGENPYPILEKPMEFIVYDENSQPLQFTIRNFEFESREAGKTVWTSTSSSSKVQIELTGSLEFDGFMNYELRLKANQDVNLKDIVLSVPMNKEHSRYIMGLGHKGGQLSNDVDWKWDVANKNQDGWWLGAVNGGLQLGLRDENYERPLNTNFYLQKPLKLPTSWGNGKKGGIQMNVSKTGVSVLNYSGEHILNAGDELYFNFTLLITPFHTLQTDEHWENRYYHAYKPIDSVISSGANVINIHHANELNPYINYPFIATRQMKDYIDAAHQEGLKVKIYNTVREVSNRLYELYPLRSLGNEVFSDGKGGGSAWLQEHLDGNYIAAWYVPRYKDAAIINSGMNRWHNYYVEGMNWLVQNIGIDGIYLDDVAFDRITMKRIKRVLTKNEHPGLIDLHSANQYNERDGYINSAYLYMEHLPYINRLWFGEYFDYEKSSPDFYMTEVSGIPFGLMGEMLQDGGNPWRGMLFGMTNRMPYQNNRPDGIWKVWDQFGMIGSQMIGYWVDDKPVKTNNDKVLVTTYKNTDKVMISVASWADADVEITLDIDWKELGIKKRKAKIYAPEIKGFQKAMTVGKDLQVQVAKNKGWLIIIE